MKVKTFVLSIVFLLLIMLEGCSKDEINEKEPQNDSKFQPAVAENYWWPVQKKPQNYTVLMHNGTLEEQMLSQSVIGIAAQCVNRGIGNEMIWEYTENPLQKRALQEISSQLMLQRNGIENIWAIIRRMADEGKITGYITYTLAPHSCNNSPDEESESVNAATILAGLYRAVLVEKKIEQQAIENGLTKIFDATTTTPLQVFNDNKSRLNNKFTYMADPAYTAGRDMVIAQCATMVHHPNQFHTQEVIKWLEPLAPVIGVTCADEAKTVLLSSIYSHFHIGLDHTNNFTFLSIDSPNSVIEKMAAFDPKSVDLTSQDKFHNVFISDGDNLGWIHDYLSGDLNGWLNPDAKEIALSWTFAPANMAAASPSGWNYYVQTKQDNCTLIEYGQYMYPDKFATALPGQRQQLLRKMAQNLGAHMQKTGATILSFICLDSHSPYTLEAYQIFAEEIDCLIGCISIQYYPYPDGKGEIDWVKKKDGTEIPVIRPKYCIVGGDQGDIFGKYQGTPSEIFLKVNEDENPLTSTVYHAWSEFTKLPGGHLASTSTQPALGTMNAISWAAPLLDSNVHLVSSEELVWRIRMKYRPQQTKSILGL